MYDDDLDALAAEYVLGTLAPDERARAEALIGVDPGFVELVHQWERRLGELNVMVEAVEPPAEIWDKIKSGIGGVAQDEAAGSAPLAPALPLTSADAGTETKAEAKADELLGAPAPSLSPPEGRPAGEAAVKSEGKAGGGFTLLPPSPPPVQPRIERSADVLHLTRRAWRWRNLAVGCGALAAVLVALIVLGQIRPDLVPAGGFHIPQLIARSAAPSTTPSAPPASRLVAVLQQDPSSPAFLLTIDPAARTMTVRRVAAQAEAGHSFELWQITPHAAKPRSLGLVGSSEYTKRPLPADVDADTMLAATYAISFEPAGGSKTGAPTGPILFTGKLVETVAPPAPQTPKT
jgi:anti-sigma-K factor RskA